MVRLRPIIWLWIALALAFGSGGTPAAARAVDEPVRVCVARMTPAMSARSVLTGSDAGFDCRLHQTSLGAGDFWVRSARLPDSLPGDVPLAVRSASLWQHASTLYALYPDGAIIATRMDDLSATRQLQLGAVLQQSLPARSRPPIRLAWRIEGAANLRGIVLAPTIANPEAVGDANVRLAALYAGFAGLLTALLIHDLALWRALRQRYQLWYAVMLIATMAYAFGLSGAWAWLWPEVPNTVRIRLNEVMFAASGAATVGFVRSLFGTRIFSGWLGRYVITVTTLAFASAAIFALAAPWHMHLLDGIYSVTGLAMLLLVVPVSWRLWREEWRIWVFALCWAAPLIVALARATHLLDRFGSMFLIANIGIIAMALQALGAALPIAQRIRTLAHERDEARVQELAARLLADTDPLTGLLNRRAFLAQGIGRTEPHRLLVLDLDHFKRINDTIGHDGGDEVLRRVARILRTSCPAGGLAARLGGEEFAMLAPVTDAPDPDALLVELRAARMPFDLTVTASVGACTGRLASEADWKQLYRAADRALFEAKAAGRDRSRSLGDLAALAA